MQNAVPYEVLGAPFTVWAAPVGTAFAEVDTEPSAPWAKVGTSGDLNYFSEGVTVEHSQTMNFFRAAGDCGSRKAFRTEEDLKIKLTLADLTLEQYAHALNSNAITTVPAAPGVAGTKSIGLSRGTAVATMALLVRGPSPEMADGVAQYEVPRAAQTGTPAPVFRNGEAAGLALEWTALVDSEAATADEYFGRLIVQTDVAET
jgi:hypothetical protein